MFDAEELKRKEEDQKETEHYNALLSFVPTFDENESNVNDNNNNNTNEFIPTEGDGKQEAI